MTITRYEITSTIIDVSFTVNDEPAHVVLDRKEYMLWVDSTTGYKGMHNTQLAMYLRAHNLHNTWQQFEGVIYSSRVAGKGVPRLERYN